MSLENRERVGPIKELVALIEKDNRKKVPRSKIQYHLEKLTKKGLISTERRKKSLKITITRIGKLYARSRRNRKFNN